MELGKGRGFPVEVEGVGYGGLTSALTIAGRVGRPCLSKKALRCPVAAATQDASVLLSALG